MESARETYIGNVYETPGEGAVEVVVSAVLEDILNVIDCLYV